MEQPRCWMWTTRKYNPTSSHLQTSSIRASSFADSWEEQAFAEDAASSLGGCIWPPRSYSCSFCRREFRSAQALGGHMNVHRRDRARLKQSPQDDHNDVVQSHHHHDHQNHNNLFQNPYTSLGFQYPSHQICPFVCSSNPNSDPGFIASPSSPSNKVLTVPNQASCDEKSFFPPYSSFPVKDELGKRPCRSSPPVQPPESDREIEEERNSRILESGCRDKLDYVKTDLSVSWNLVLRRTRTTLSDNEDEEEEAIGRKRRRISTISKTSNIVEKHGVQSEIIGLNPCSIEELDLELRLGDRPKVK